MYNPLTIHYLITTYSERYNEETTEKGKRFLLATLTNFKKLADENINQHSFIFSHGRIMGNGCNSRIDFT